MAVFKITSKLSPTERARVNRAAESYAEQGDATMDAGSFVRIGPNTYTNNHDSVDVNVAARHAMTVAGRTFDYEVY